MQKFVYVIIGEKCNTKHEMLQEFFYYFHLLHFMTDRLFPQVLLFLQDTAKMPESVRLPALPCWFLSLTQGIFMQDKKFK